MLPDAPEQAGTIRRHEVTPKAGSLAASQELRSEHNSRRSGRTPVGCALHMFDVFAEARFEAGGDDAIATVILEEVCEYLAAHPEVGMRSAIDALGFRQAQAHGAQQAQSTVFPCSGSQMMLPGSPTP